MIKKGTLFLVACLLFLFYGQVLHATNDGLLIAPNPNAKQEVVVYSGYGKASGVNQELFNVFTLHVGGKFDASVINEGSYFTIKHGGDEGGVYFAMNSASGGTGWAAVYPSSTETLEDGTYLSTFTYDDFSKAYGTNFARLDIIQVYSKTAGEVYVTEILYHPGEGDRVDQTDGTWDRQKGGIAFIGDSIVQNAKGLYDDWNGFLGREDCSNYGIGGQTTVEVSGRIGDLIKGEYEKVFFILGINDLGWNKQTFITISNYRSMIEQIHEALPDTKVYIISVLPTTEAFFKDQQSKIQMLNLALKNLTNEFDCASFIDVYSSMVGEDGYAKAEYLSDGLHPNKKGYELIAEVILPYVEESNQDNIPEPEQTEDASEESQISQEDTKEKEDQQTADEKKDGGVNVALLVAVIAVMLLIVIPTASNIARKKKNHGQK